MARRRYPVEVRFADLDPMGHVNNVAYLVYFQETRLKLLYDALGGTLGDVNQVVVRNEVDYLKQMAFTLEPALVETWVSDIGRSSYTVEAEMRDAGGDLVARGRTVLVNLRADGSSSAPLTDGMRQSLELARDERA